MTGFWSHGARGPARPWGECTVARIPWAVASLLRLHRPALPRTAQRSREAAPPGPRAMKAGTETGAVQELAQASSGHTPGRDRLKLPLGKRSYCTRQATMRDSDAKGCGNRTWARKEGLRLSCCQRRPRGPHLRVRCSTGNGGCGGRPGAQLPHCARGASAAPERGSCDQEKQRAPRGAASDGSGGSEETCEALHVSTRAENHTFTYDAR